MSESASGPIEAMRTKSPEIPVRARGRRGGLRGRSVADTCLLLALLAATGVWITDQLPAPPPSPPDSPRRNRVYEPYAPIFALIESGDLEALRTALEDGEDLDVWGWYGGGTPMYFAALEGCEFVELLLEYGGDPNGWGPAGRSPLMGALREYHPEAIEPLLAAGADPNKHDSLGDTPLHALSVHAPDEARKYVKMLVDAGADLEALDSDGDTPLLEAIDRGYNGVALSLIDAGADITAQDAEGIPALLMAFAHDRREVAEAVLRQIIGEIDEDAGLTERFRQGARRMAAKPLGVIAGVNATDEDGLTALHRAIGDREMVELLLTAGANPDIPDNDGDTPLHRATARGHRLDVRELLQAGANPNAKNNSGRTPLDIAPGTNTDVQSLLREHGAR